MPLTRQPRHAERDRFLHRALRSGLPRAETPLSRRATPRRSDGASHHRVGCDPTATRQRRRSAGAAEQARLSTEQAAAFRAHTQQKVQLWRRIRTEIGEFGGQIGRTFGRKSENSGPKSDAKSEKNATFRRPDRGGSGTGRGASTAQRSQSKTPPNAASEAPSAATSDAIPRTLKSCGVRNSVL